MTAICFSECCILSDNKRLKNLKEMNEAERVQKKGIEGFVAYTRKNTVEGMGTHLFYSVNR